MHECQDQELTACNKASCVGEEWWIFPDHNSSPNKSSRNEDPFYKESPQPGDQNVERDCQNKCDEWVGKQEAQDPTKTRPLDIEAVEGILWECLNWVGGQILEKVWRWRRGSRERVAESCTRLEWIKWEQNFDTALILPLSPSLSLWRIFFRCG